MYVFFVIDPFTLDRFDTFRMVYQVTNLILVHGCYLGFHDIKPSFRVRARHCFFVIHRFILIQQENFILARILPVLRGSGTLLTKVSSSYANASSSVAGASWSDTEDSLISSSCTVLPHLFRVKLFLEKYSVLSN